MADRIKMDRRRLEQAHFRYAALNVVSWYPNMLEIARLEFGNDAVTLMKLTTNYNKAFHDIYSGTQSHASTSP